MKLDEAPRPRVYSGENISMALDAFATDRGLESRFEAMKAVIVEALEHAGYLKPPSDTNFLATMSNDATF